MTIVALALVVSLVLCGCADDRRPAYPAGGVVTLSNGSPLPGGWIEFQVSGGASAPTSKAKIQPDGRFELGTYAEADGAFEGKHRVMIMPPVPPFRKPEGRPPPLPDDPRYPKINRRYRNFATSGLEYTVSTRGAENRFEIQLEE